jgi:hypothetical protein
VPAHRQPDADVFAALNTAILRPALGRLPALRLLLARELDYRHLFRR